MILIICAWIYCFLLCLSIGTGSLKLISRINRNIPKIQFGVFYTFWFGFAILIGLLQVISLFLPMSTAAFIMISLLGVFFAAIHFRSVLSAVKLFSRWAMTPKGMISLLVTGVMLLMVSYSGNKEITHTDTFIYHFNAVKWAKEYPVVPGLVNLHNRLGFNSSFFLFAAFTEIGIYAGQSSHIALPFLMVVCLLHWFFIISNPKEVMVKRIFCMMTFVYLIIHISYKMDINSLATDYPMAVLTLVFCIALLDKLEHKMLLLLPVAAVIFSFKLSGMLTIGVAVAIMAGYLFLLKYGPRKESSKGEMKILIVSFVLLCFIAAGFITRNIIVSGWLIYPFPIGNLHLPWSVSKPYVMDMLAWIKSYPKIPGGASPETIAGNRFFYWFTRWFGRFGKSDEFLMLIAGIFLLLWTAFRLSSFAKFMYARLNVITLVFFSAASIVFWFTSAPDVRFGSVYFYMFFAGAIALCYEGSGHKPVLKFFIYIAFIYQVVYQMTAYSLDRGPDLFTFAYTPVPKLNRVVISPENENPPLYIYMPAEGNQCGDSPIPCTPYAGGLLHSHQMIRQRVPGDLSKGFLPMK